MATDWDKVELDYRCGLHSDKAICDTHGITKRELDNAVETRMWTQEILKPEDEATVIALSEQDTPRYPIDSLFSPDDVKRKVLITAGQVVKVHRDEIAKMRGVTTEVLNRLVDYLDVTKNAEMVTDEDGKQSVQSDGKAIPKLLLVLGKDSPADLLEKLSRIMVRMTELERQAYGLDSMTIIPDEAGDNQITKDIRSLSERIRQITAEKAQKVESKKDIVKVEDAK